MTTMVKAKTRGSYVNIYRVNMHGTRKHSGLNVLKSSSLTSKERVRFIGILSGRYSNKHDERVIINFRRLNSKFSPTFNFYVKMSSHDL